jgi:hypothetical protein
MDKTARKAKRKGTDIKNAIPASISQLRGWVQQVQVILLRGRKKTMPCCGWDRVDQYLLGQCHHGREAEIKPYFTTIYATSEHVHKLWYL